MDCSNIFNTDHQHIQNLHQVTWMKPKTPVISLERY